MKTTYKILILCVSVIIAVSAVMIYAKTSVSPPEAVKEKDRYTENLKETQNRLNNNASDTLFDNEVCRAEIFRNEEKITDGCYDSTINAAVAAYVPGFLNQCLNHFSQSSWSNDVINAMSPRFTELRNVKLSNGATALTADHQAAMSKINGIIGNYRRALQVCRSTGFHGIDAARNTINTANSLADDQYLKNNTSLVSNLRTVRSAIGESHYRWLEVRVNRLNSLYEPALSNYANQVQTDLDEYKKYAASLYGSARSVSSLEDRAREIIINKEDYEKRPATPAL